MRTAIAIVVAAALAPSAAAAQSGGPSVKARTVVRVDQQTEAQRERIRQQQERIRQQQERARAARDEQERRRFPDEQSDRISRTLKIGQNGELDLSNLSGDIVISRGSGGSVQIEAVKVARGRTPEDTRRVLDLVRVEFAERGSRAEVTVVYPRQNQERNAHVSVQFTVTAPERTRISARSLSGSIRVSDMKSDVNAVSLSGHVVVENGAGVVSAKSTSGNVEIGNVKSEMRLEAQTISGQLTVRDSAAPRMDLETVSGAIVIHELRCERLEAQTLSGDIDFTAPLQRNGRYEFSSHSGVIRIVPTGNTGFEIEAESFSGHIESALSLKDVRQASHDPEARPVRGRARSLTGTYGDGSAHVEATTFSGRVILGKK